MVLMDLNSLREKDLAIDLENGTNTSIKEEEESRNPSSKNFLNRVWIGFVSSDGTTKVEESVSSRNNFFNSLENPLENGEGLVDKRSGQGEEKASLSEKKAGGDKPKKKSCKKPPKPPRPPRAPSMDAADQKMIREISELAMLKRARIERMKALKRTKNTKSTSSNSNLLALIITIIFCFVIIWQGVFSRGSSGMSFQGSPESSIGAGGGFISVQVFKNVSTSQGSGSASPNNIEQISGLDEHGKANKAAG